MEPTISNHLEPPRIEDGKQLSIAGLCGHFTGATAHTIPQLWQRFAPYIGKVPGQDGWTTYGVCFNNSPAGFDYLSGVEVSGTPALPADFCHLAFPKQRYAVFTHHGHVSELRNTLDAISRVGVAPAHPLPGAPDFFERYDHRFDPRTGKGEIEIWIPVKAE